MAAPYVTAVRTALKGVRLVPSRWLLTPPGCQCLRLPAAWCRQLHVAPSASLCSSSSSRPEPQKSTQSHSKTGTHTDDKKATEEEEEDEEPDGPEYIPKRKAKNPMMNIGYAWPPYRYHRLPPGQETSGQEQTEAAQGSTENEEFKRGRL
ncbi:uncharacterized protein V6R79_008658 [Siganus canaliculatus]